MSRLFVFCSFDTFFLKLFFGQVCLRVVFLFVIETNTAKITIAKTKRKQMEYINSFSRDDAKMLAFETRKFKEFTQFPQNQHIPRIQFVLPMTENLICESLRDLSSDTDESDDEDEDDDIGTISKFCCSTFCVFEKCIGLIY